MLITTESTVADIATNAPATIRIFQRHHIDFCCGGRVPLGDHLRRPGAGPGCARGRTRGRGGTADRCAVVGRRHVGVAGLAHPAPLPRAPARGTAAPRGHARQGREPAWRSPARRPAAAAAHVRGAAGRVARAHAARGPGAVPVHRRARNGAAPAGRTPRRGSRRPSPRWRPTTSRPARRCGRCGICTNGYAPPEWACPTFRGLYYGLSQLEADMHLHVHLENHILFPRPRSWRAASACKPAYAWRFDA